MRRALILLLVSILPLKAIGAVVVPITGAPHHHHAVESHGSAADNAPVPEHSAHSACDGMSQDVGADSGVVHEHACPHLAMVTVVQVFSLPEPDRRAPEIEREPARPLSSIVLEILVPPPTLQS